LFRLAQALWTQALAHRLLEDVQISASARLAIVWSFKAEAMTAPGKVATTTAAGKSESSPAKAA
jgi:hypothetical protein